ncbi:hypothetical protein CF327_g6582 [Tilletia walkeri]|nr:hypothetical protein CF327_g6582 [Tilletia walkeri]
MSPDQELNVQRRHPASRISESPPSAATTQSCRDEEGRSPASAFRQMTSSSSHIPPSTSPTSSERRAGPHLHRRYHCPVTSHLQAGLRSRWFHHQRRARRSAQASSCWAPSTPSSPSTPSISPSGHKSSSSRPSQPRILSPTKGSAEASSSAASSALSMPANSIVTSSTLPMSDPHHLQSFSS